MTTTHSLFSFIRSLVFRLFTFLFGAPKLVVAPAPVASQVLRKPTLTAHARRRIELRARLGRIDGGGRHYGSKRAVCNHGSGSGKRSGRA